MSRGGRGRGRGGGSGRGGPEGEDWVLEDSRAAELHMKKAKKDHFATFRKGHLSVAQNTAGSAGNGRGGGAPVQANTSANSSLIQRIFLRRQWNTPTLPPHLLPAPPLVDATMALFGRLREQLMEMRLVVEEILTTEIHAPAVKAKVPPRPLWMPVTYKPAHWYKVLDAVFASPPRDGIIGNGDTSEKREMPVSLPRLDLAAAAHLDEGYATQLVLVLMRRLMRLMKNEAPLTEDEVQTRKTKKRKRGADEDDSDEEGSSIVDSSDEEDIQLWKESLKKNGDQQETEEGEEDAEQRQEFDETQVTTDEKKQALRLVSYLSTGQKPRCAATNTNTASSPVATSTSTSFGYWLYVALASMSMPFDADTGRTLQSFFSTCVTALKTLDPPSQHQGGGGTAPTAVNELVNEAEPVPKEEEQGVANYGRGVCSSKDISTLYALIIILGKYFQQARAELLPL